MVNRFLFRSYTNPLRILTSTNNFRANFKTFQFVQSQGVRKFYPQEYMAYFEDYNLSQTQRWVKMGRFEIASSYQHIVVHTH